MKSAEKPAMATAARDKERRFGAPLTEAGGAIIADARRTLSDSQLSEAQAMRDRCKTLERRRALMRRARRLIPADWSACEPRASA